MIARERLWYSPLRFAYYIVRREVNYAFYGTYACNTRIVRYVWILRRLVVLIASDSNKTAFSFGSKRPFDSRNWFEMKKAHHWDVPFLWYPHRESLRLTNTKLHAHHRRTSLLFAVQLLTGLRYHAGAGAQFTGLCTYPPVRFPMFVS